MVFHRTAILFFSLDIIFIFSIETVHLADSVSTVTVLVGKPLIIKCRKPQHSDVIDIKLQWSKDMFGLESSTLAEVYKNRIFVPTTESSGIFDLNFKSTEADDQGLYGCHVDLTLKSGQMINIVEKTYLKIIIPPSNLQINPKTNGSDNTKILWLSQDKTIWGIENQILILNCSSEVSNPAAQVMWTMKTDSTSFEIRNLQSDQSVVIKLSRKIQNSIVTCNIRNKKDYLDSDLPSVNYTIRLLYFTKPYITSDDEKLDGQIREGEVATFACNTEVPKEPNVFYSWFIRYSSPIVFDHYFVNDSTSNRITLKMSQKHHKGKLHCLLKSKLETNECNRQINHKCELELTRDVEEKRQFNILYPPKIENPFENVTVTNIGEWITLTCNVDSNPPVMVRWYKTHIGTTRNSRSINWYHQTKISNLIDSLRIENIVISSSYHKFQVLNDQDFDIYVCEARSTIFESAYKYVVVAKEGNCYYHYLKFIVLFSEEISIKTDRSTIKINEGGSASLMCLVEGWPRPSTGSVQWQHIDSQTPLLFSERLYTVNKNQLMAIESKLYFKNVINSDYGSYNCSIVKNGKKISKKIDLQPIKDPLVIFALIGVIGLLFVIITVIIITCISRKLYEYKKMKTRKVKCTDYSPPIQASMLPSATMDSCMENDGLYNRLNSFSSFQKTNSCNESINITPNRCFIFNNKHQILRIPSLDSRNILDDMSNSKANGSNRSWDSGVGPDDAIYRNGQIMQNTKGSRCISPFSTMASSNNSIGPHNQINNANGRYWPHTGPIELINQSNIENDQSSTFNGSVHSFVPSNADGIVPLIASKGNQSFVCIPIEEYHQHIRLLQESRGQPSVHSLSSSSFIANNDTSAFNNNYKMFNDDLSPTENSVKSVSINSKP